MISVIKVRNMRCAWHVAFMTEMRNTHLWSQKLKGIDKLGEFSIGDGIILKWISRQ